MGESHISTQILRARTAADARSAWVAAIAIPLMLLAPAIWNGYPLLQWDTGGYLARWYEGYLVPSRSTTFGLYLHFGEDSSVWINLGINALATLWILQLTLRVLGMPQPLRLLAISLVLVLTTSLPWLASTLLTDIFAGLSVLALFILVVQGERTSIREKCLLFGLTAFAAATHSATLAVLSGLCGIGWIARPFLRSRISVSGLTQGSLTIVAGALLLLSTNFALSGKLAWTPGSYGVAFGRMLQDGIVAQYLRDHCPKQRVHFDFTAINRIHVPVALASMLLAAILFGHGVLHRTSDDLTLLAGTITLAVLGNAFVCAVISGPHDRYGARMAWLATMAMLIAAMRHFTGNGASRDRSSPA